MEGGKRTYQGIFLSSGEGGYRAPSPRKSNVKQIIQHMRQCRNEMTHDVMLLQQVALEQERLEQQYDQLAIGVKALVEVVEELEEGAVITNEWIKHRDQAIMIIRMVIGEAQQNA
jgi:hypothetical protein